MKYMFYCEDRNYNSWYIENKMDKSIVETNETSNLNIQPIREKLFNSDTFELSGNNCIIEHSSLRMLDQIPGVLVLENNKMYGKYKNKYLYKFITDDKRIPSFLVPYELKKMGFEKKINNKFALIKFEHWNNKHPFGIVQNILGDVDKLECFYEYQLYCKSIHTSIQKFTKEAKKSIKNISLDKCIDNIIEKNNFEDRLNYNIFSIDSDTTTDYDDAISIQEHNDYNVISVYISNVIVWLEVLDLWDSFAERISTIYLPNHKRTMLPTILSECLCSLQENDQRFAFCIDFIIKNNKIINVEYKSCKIKLIKNYAYEEESLLNDEKYNKIKNILQELCKEYKLLKSINNSYDVVSYLMILTNYYSAKQMRKHNNAIYRCVELKKENTDNLPDNLPDNVCKFIQVWSNTSGSYKYQEESNHDTLNVDYYIHITSPIRRLVDLLNMIIFMKNENLMHISEKALLFYDKWIKQLDNINTSMRAIRKVQVDCDLLNLCINDSTTLENTYEGYIFDKIKRTDGLFVYTVYLPEIKMLSRIYIPYEKDNYERGLFKLHLFYNQDNLKKKIRLEML